jgi:hypothetical protein
MTGTSDSGTMNASATDTARLAGGVPA